MRIWVTRDEPPDGPLCVALRQAGLTPVLEAVIERHVLSDGAEAIRRLGPDDWLILTSVFAIDVVAAEPARIPKVAVVGEVTRQAALARGFRVEQVAPASDHQSLLNLLRRTVRSGKIGYPRSSLAKPPKPWRSVEIISPILYDTTPRDFDRSVVHRADAITVTSPSAVDAIGRVNLPFASIGPTTSQALRQIGMEPWVEAAHRDFESLARAIASASLRHDDAREPPSP